MTRRRKVWIGVATLAALALFLVPTCAPPPLDSAAYLQAVTATEAVIARWTASPRQLGLVVRKDGKDVFAAAAGIPRAHHELRATGLVAGTRYEFALRDEDGNEVERGSFVTRSEDDRHPVHFAVFGDSGGQPWWVEIHDSPLMRLLHAHRWLPIERAPAAVAALLLAEAPDFALHVGDVVYPRGELQHYNAGFFRPFGEFARSRPIYPVFGNHDVMTGDGDAFRQVFAVPEDDPGEHCFSFREGPLRVIGLDLNGEVDAQHRSIRYLRRALETAEEPWILVYSHYPLRSVYRPSPRPDLLAHYGPLCREFGVDLICAGHDHNYQRYGRPGETIEVVSGGGGKSLYEINQRPDGLEVAEIAYHASFIRIDRLTLRFVAKAIDGRILDEFTIDKAAQLRDGTAKGNPARLLRMQRLVN
jgi:predicted phosphodiesterase